MFRTKLGIVNGMPSSNKSLTFHATFLLIFNLPKTARKTGGLLAKVSLSPPNAEQAIVNVLLFSSEAVIIRTDILTVELDHVSPLNAGIFLAICHKSSSSSPKSLPFSLHLISAFLTVQRNVALEPRGAETFVGPSRIL